ncbi:MAG TPA: zf-HC2 domain-containing protein [Pyrinomonadaceae bacterium]|nr:zf-HC2 domain-containing protein [Pyrinomonadaceae bacterium]
MNCTKIEKLLPLYVGGDLSGRDASHVASHLSSCDGCRAIAQEFEASRERLSNFAVPEFGAEFYEQLRGAVMSEINSRPAARPSMLQTLRAFFPARPALVASLATLALFCALSFALYRSLVNDEPGLAALEQSMANLNLEMPAVDGARPVSSDVVSDSPRAGRTVFTAGNIARRKAVRGNPTNALPETSSPEIADAASSAARQAVRQTSGATADEATRQVVARMDIQTSDPNIRIIWLGRKTSE